MKNGFIFIDLSKQSLWPPREISLDAFTTLTAFSPVEPKSHVWAPSASQRCSQDVIKVEKLLGKVNSLYMGEVPWFVFVSWSLVKTKKHRSPCGANPSSPWRLLLSCSSLPVFPGWRVLLFSLCSKALLCSLGSSLLLFSKPLPYAIYSNSLSGKPGPVPWVLEPEHTQNPGHHQRGCGECGLMHLITSLQGQSTSPVPQRQAAALARLRCVQL